MRKQRNFNLNPWQETESSDQYLKICLRVPSWGRQAFRGSSLYSKCQRLCRRHPRLPWPWGLAYPSSLLPRFVYSTSLSPGREVLCQRFTDLWKLWFERYCDRWQRCLQFYQLIVERHPHYSVSFRQAGRPAWQTDRIHADPSSSGRREKFY